MMRRLYRSRTQRVIGGVCGGLGEYFNIDPALWRVAFVVLAFINGLGIIAYLAMWLVFPRQVPQEEPETAEKTATGQEAEPDEKIEPLFKPRAQRAFWLGVLLVILGLGWLFNNLYSDIVAPIFLASLGFVPFPFAWWPLAKAIWPLSLVVGGVIVLLIRRGK